MLSVGSASESSTAVTKELSLDEGIVDGAAVDDDKRAVDALRCLVHGPSAELFACPRLTPNE